PRAAGPTVSGHHQLGRCDVEIHDPVTTYDAQREPPVDRVADHQALQVVGAFDRDTVDIEHDVRGAEPGAIRGTPCDHLDHLDPVRPVHRTRHARGQWTAAAGDADVRAPETALAHERTDDAPRRRVHRHGEPQPDPRDRGVDPDQPAPAVDERTPGVSRVQGGIGLDDVLD